jgi:Phage portal protein, lambda family
MRTEWRLYAATEWERGRRTYYPMLDPEADRHIDQWSISKLRSDSRKVFVNFGPLRTAVYERARYSVGHAWLPRFTGENTDWGKQATRWLTEIWFQTGNLAGPTWNWWESLQIESRYLDVFGEIFIYKIIDGNGFPRYQHIPPYRIDVPRAPGSVNNDGELSTGPYAGLKCVYGVVQDEAGTAVAYNVRGKDSESDRIIPADQLLHIGQWEFVDQTRPISNIAHGILDIRDSMAVQTNEKRALEIASAIAILESNPMGGADVNDPTVFYRMEANRVGAQIENPGQPVPPGYQTDPAPVVPYKYSDNGEYKFFKAGTGSDVKAFQFQRPSEQVATFLDRLGRNCINFIWPYDLIMAPTAPNSGATRSLWVRANNLTRERQVKLYPGAKQRILFALSRAIELGILSENEDWMEWEFSLPRKPSIDAGRDAQQDREDLKAGIRTWTDIHAELGTDTETQAFRKAMDLVAMLRAKRMAEQVYFEQTGEHISLPDSYMFQFTPNATAASSNGIDVNDPSQFVRLSNEPEDQGTAEPGELEAEGTGESEGTGQEPEADQAGDEEIEKTESTQDTNLVGAQT